MSKENLLARTFAGSSSRKGEGIYIKSTLQNKLTIDYNLLWGWLVVFPAGILRVPPTPMHTHTYNFLFFSVFCNNVHIYFN